MNYNKIFSKVPVRIPNKSGFDMSHENVFTAPVGTLIPSMVEELLPNDTVTLGVSSQVQLPPMATDFYGNVKAKFEAFFVPFRLLYGGWQEFITNPTNEQVNPSHSDMFQRCKYLPFMSILRSKIGPGTLADYLGFKTVVTEDVYSEINNPLPFLAYHKIYDDWYRDSRIQTPVFQRLSDSSMCSASELPYYSSYSDSPSEIENTELADGVDILSLRQRNWSRDYFTNATPLPQAGIGQSVAMTLMGRADEGDTIGPLEFDVNGELMVGSNQPDEGSNPTVSFSIASLRAANSIQQWLERNNLAGFRYGDQIKAHFGIYPSDAVLDRCLYLGSKTINVYNKSVYTQSETSATRNPFTSTGAKYSNAQAVGDGSLVDKFTATEHGFIFVMFSLVPEPMYGTGIRKYLSRQSVMDFAFPLLAGVGDQEIMSPEISDDDERPATFGYTQRYSEYKFHGDEVHGLLRDNQSLEAFSLKRSYTGTPRINSSFIQIPTTSLDEVLAVSADSSYGCWVDAFFSFKKSSTLPAYSIPTLGDMHDCHTEIIDNGGKRL